jgi:hypothetical protein
MQVVIRNYSGKGARELFDLLEKHPSEVQAAMKAVKGFVSYTLARTEAGGFSVTICQDKAGIDDSVQKAKEWVAKNAASTGVAAPDVSQGNIIIHAG